MRISLEHLPPDKEVSGAASQPVDHTGLVRRPLVEIALYDPFWRFFVKVPLYRPNTPSTLYSSQALNKFRSQSFVGNSSSSMNAKKSPVAFSTALFRASAIFCRGSSQYRIGIVEECANSDTTGSADLS